MKKMMLLVVVLITALLVALTGCAGATGGAAATQTQTGEAQASAPGDAAPAEITVSASGTVKLAPDKATISFGVSTQAATAEQAQNENGETVKHIVAVLTERGIQEKSIRTEYYSLYPQYDYSYSDPQITGYSATTTMSVQDQNVEDLGKLIAACVEAGVTNVDNVSLLCSGYDEAYQQALSKALEAARVKAEGLAGAAGKALGEVVNVTEGWQDTSSRYGLSMSTAAAEDNAGDGGPAIQPGESEITANVTVTYRMQ